MTKPKAHSRETRKAVALLGELIKVARKQRKWTEEDLAQRAGIARATLQKIERGHMGCSIGLAFELAVLMGVELFEQNSSPLSRQLQQTAEKLSLLPRRIRPKEAEVDDDF